MKAFLLIFASVLVSCARAMTIQEQRQMMVGVAQECKNEAGATDNELSLLILKKPMTTKEGKCLVACIMRDMGIVDQNTRKINMDGFIEYISVPAKNDAGIIKKMTEIAKDCGKITDPDECEMAFQSAACFKKGMIANKIKIDIGL